jgi:hypothetical protein
MVQGMTAIGYKLGASDTEGMEATEAQRTDIVA